MSAYGRLGLALVAGLAFGVTVSTAQAAPVSLTPTPKSDASICGNGGRIEGFKPAVAKDRKPPRFPDSDISRDSEGWVRIGFTITAEGETKDIVILDRVGSKRMLSGAISAVEDWEYEPATLNGQPAEQYGNTAEFLYELQNTQSRAVHTKVIELYDRGRALVGAGQISEGIAILDRAKQTNLNMFELSMISFALAYAHSQAGDPIRALPEIRHAMIEDGKYLEKRIQNPAKRLRIRLEAQAKNWRYVACAPSLAPTDDFDPKGVDRADLMRIVGTAASTLKSSAPLVQAAALGKPRDDDEQAVLELSLNRPKFSFNSIVGNLTRFRVNCVVHVVEDSIKEGTQWTLPQVTGPCTLRVWGQAGTTFKLVEDW